VVIQPSTTPFDFDTWYEPNKPQNSYELDTHFIRHGGKQSPKKIVEAGNIDRLADTAAAQSIRVLRTPQYRRSILLANQFTTTQLRRVYAYS